MKKHKGVKNFPDSKHAPLLPYKAELNGNHYGTWLIDFCEGKLMLVLTY